MFLRDAWYMVGWSRDLPEGELTPFTLLSETIVLFRRRDGVLAALADRCSHRLAKLSLGQIEGDDVRCLYHGLKFDAAGRCVEMPLHDRVSATMNVRAYPVVERHGGAWVWMGEPEKADPAAIPRFVGVDDPAWAMLPGRMNYQASYELVNDNLLDLSHVTYVHRNSFLGGRPVNPKALDTARPTVVQLDDGVRVTRCAESMPISHFVQHRIGGGLCDHVMTYDFLVPGLFLMRHTLYPQGTLQRARERGLDPRLLDDRPLHDSFTSQAVTPITETTCCYFFAYGPWSHAGEDRELFAALGEKAFTEDRLMIEGQQRSIDAARGQPMKMLGFDAAAVMFSRIMKQRIDAQNTARPA